MAQPTSPAMAIRKFFNDPRFPVKLAEIKEFKVEDPAGYDEIGAACVKYYEDC
jgi:hypothetical protein